MPFKKCWFILFLIITAAGCSPAPDADIYESNGIISITKDNIIFDENWESVEHYSSIPMRLQNSESTKASTRFYVQKPGLYTLWMLGATAKKTNGNNPIHILVSDTEGYLVHQGSFLPDNSEYLIWSQYGDSRTGIEFEQAGFYNISLTFSDYSGFLLEKIHLSVNDNYPPSGFGFSETTEPEIKPVLKKRQQPVMLPPAWAFGLMIWAENDGESAIESLLGDKIWADAVLSSPKIIENEIQQSTAWKKQKSHFTANIIEGSGEEFIQHNVSLLENRPFIISGMQNIHNPVFKKLPAKWANVSEKTATVGNISEALQQQIEFVANPRLATSEAPFVSNGMNRTIANIFDGEITDEMVIRWIQFSSLSGLMHLYIPPKGISATFSAVVTEEIRKMTNLRSRLFPYLYSLAHLVRATAENPVRGDGEHTLQYRLGEAFLAAPVYREGVDTRLVWLPDGTWYDYWSSERFDGGQTWLIDVSVDEIPLFVKAGSIVPYRTRAQQIMQGSNDELTIEIYAGGVGTFRLYEDDGFTNRYRNGEVATTGFRYFETDEYATFTIGRTAGDYEGKVKKRTLELLFLHAPKPSRVTANSNIVEQGNGVGEWSYDNNNQTLTIRWKQSTELKTDFEIRFN